MDRRQFLKTAGITAGGLAAAPSLEALTDVTRLDDALAARRAPSLGKRSPDVVVVGAGAFGGWTALYLQQRGANVTLVDQYGPGNSRASSGDETRGVRSSYGDRDHGRQWMRWANESIRRWIRFDEEFGRERGLQLFFQTGDLIARAAPEPFLDRTAGWWTELGVRHDVLTGDEVRYRYPQMRLDDIQVGLYEHDAGVVRARRACEAVAEAFRRQGGTLLTARAECSTKAQTARSITLAPGGTLSAGTFVFACGPWLAKVFPAELGNRMRAPMGHVFYYGTPPGDERFTFPHMPSWNFSGTTGWPALTPDNRGFRVRAGGRAQADPDEVERFMLPEQLERPRDILVSRFPALADAPLLETRACHYELSVSRNFIIDRLPGSSNVWVAGAGNAEGFKMGPVIGEYVANRVLGTPTAPELDAQFVFPTAEYDA